MVLITQALKKHTGLFVPEKMIQNDDDATKSNRNDAIKINRKLTFIFVLFYVIRVLRGLVDPMELLDQAFRA